MLQTALEHGEGHHRLIGYDFNPASTFSLATTFVDGQLTVHASETQLEASWVGFRVHVLAFDWEAMTGNLYSGGWHFEQGVQNATTYAFPEPGVSDRSLFYLLEVQEFEEKEGAFLPLEGKSLQLVGYEAALKSLENDVDFKTEGGKEPRSTAIEPYAKVTDKMMTLSRNLLSAPD